MNNLCRIDHPLDPLLRVLLSLCSHLMLFFGISFRKRGERVKHYQIRPAEFGDTDSIASVAMESWRHTYQSIYPEDIIHQFVTTAYSVENLTGSIARDHKRTHPLFHVATDSNGEVIAFSQVVPHPNRDTSFELVRIYAVPRAHGTGVGSAFLHHLLQTVPCLHELTAWVERENTIGRRFYERHAFQIIDEKEDDFLGYKTHLLRYAFHRHHD
ncbi:GNAT family N-acetyltransferase [Alicyclobacillus macrosporangiidus]|uniref:GNAT family N-acetyltransferase n=1 Tax=Alicyclobacillus macrosporangiidus TaxID=392015 RepID=UPI0009F80D30